MLSNLAFTSTVVSLHITICMLPCHTVILYMYNLLLFCEKAENVCRLLTIFIPNVDMCGVAGKCRTL